MDKKTTKKRLTETDVAHVNLLGSLRLDAELLLLDLVLGDGLVHADLPAAEARAVQGGDACLDLLRRAHVDEGETSGLAAVAVARDADQLDASVLREQVPNFRIRGVCN